MPHTSGLTVLGAVQVLTAQSVQMLTVPRTDDDQCFYSITGYCAHCGGNITGYCALLISVHTVLHTWENWRLILCGGSDWKHRIADVPVCARARRCTG